MLVYDLIAEDKESAVMYALCGAALSESEMVECNIRYKDYIDTVNGLDIWYDCGADYYFFSDSWR